MTDILLQLKYHQIKLNPYSTYVGFLTISYLINYLIKSH